MDREKMLQRLSEINADILKVEASLEKLYAARREAINYLNLNKESSCTQE